MSPYPPKVDIGLSVTFASGRNRVYVAFWHNVRAQLGAFEGTETAALANSTFDRAGAANGGSPPFTSKCAGAWAQVLQFALELMANPSSHIREMLEAPDEAFATGLRLVGRCIANGATVDEELHTEIGSKLAELWGEAHYKIREKVGRLIVDAFSQPLHPEVRCRLGWRWLMNNGAAEIVTMANDPSLTRAVVDQLLAGKLDMFMSSRGLRTALQEIAPDVVVKVTERAQRQGTTAKELEGLAEFLEVIHLDEAESHLLKPLADDEAMPLPIRFAAHAAMAPPPNQATLAIAKAALSDPHWRNRSASLQVFARTEDIAGIACEVLTDSSLSTNAKTYLVEYLGRLIPDRVARGEAAGRALSLPGLSSRHQDILRVYALRAGNRETFVEMIGALDRLSAEAASAVLASLNRFPEKLLGERAKEKVRMRRDLPADVPNLIGATMTGLTSAIGDDGFNLYSIYPAPQHPSFNLWAPVLDDWLSTEGLTKVQRLRTITPLLGVRPELFEELKAIVFSATNPDSVEWDEDAHGHHLRSAMDDLRRRRVHVPLRLAETFTLAERPNLPFAGISAIAAVATPEALDLLLSIYRRTNNEDRSIVFDAIEVVASRLNVLITQKDLKNGKQR